MRIPITRDEALRSGAIAGAFGAVFMMFHFVRRLDGAVFRLSENYQDCPPLFWLLALIASVALGRKGETACLIAKVAFVVFAIAFGAAVCGTLML